MCEELLVRRPNCISKTTPCLRYVTVCYKWTDMPLILRCVPFIHDFDSCICTTSLKTSTKIIGWIALVVSVCTSIRYALRLSQFQETQEIGILTTTKVSECKEFFIFELVAYMTIAVLSLLLLLGVHCDIPVLMLPSLLMQLLIETFLALLHTMLFLVSGVSDMRYGLLAVTTCVTIIGLLTFLWMVQYNCYRQFVDKRHCTCGEMTKSMSQCPEGVLYHSEGRQDDYTALSAVFTMYALTMMNNDHNHGQG